MAESQTAEVVETQAPTPMSFDDLESGISSSEMIPEVDDIPSTPKDEGEVEADDTEASESEAQESEEASEEVEEDVKAEKSEKKADAKSEEKAQSKGAKVYKVKNGEEVVKLPADAQFEVKVRGEKQQVNLQDLLSNYSGQIDFSRKYSELGTEKQKFERERDNLQASVNRLYELAVEKNDPQQAIMFLSEALGGDPLETWRKIEENVASRLQEEQSLSPEAKELKMLKAQQEWQKKRQEDARQRQESEQTQTEMSTRVKTVQDKTGMDEKAFFTLYNELSQSGDVPLEKLTPELVGEVFEANKAQGSISQMIQEIAPELENHQEAVGEILDAWAKHPELEVEDLREVIVEAFGDKGKKNLSRKVKKARAQSTVKRSQDKDGDPILFTDLD